MKRLVLFVAVVFMATSLIGCNKKKKDDSTSMEGLNGVVSENVVSVTDQGQNQGMENIPVVVDNADSAAVSEQAPAAEGVAMAGKPTAKQIQQALKNAGLYNGKVDGNIGPKTKQAIEAFQTQNGLKADGKVGTKTWKALSAFLNKPAEVANPTATTTAQ